MIRHCVFIRFRDDVDAAEIDRLLGAIVELGNHLPGVADVHVAANTSPEVGMDHGFAHGFIVDFESTAARDAYLVDERHRRAGAALAAAADGGAAGIFVYDLEI